MCGLVPRHDPRLIIGFGGYEDAGVYRLDEKTALVQTVDFFTPIVDDPYMFGQIAAANALSDVYAMGGVPLTALNIVAFPVRRFAIDILHQILRGGIDKLNEAEVTLVGGHSVEDEEIKYGLAVTGTIAPDRVIRNNSSRAGDRLILTKPLGTGIINTAIKAEIADSEVIATVQRVMAELNRQAARAMLETTVHACTDVTGFGLLGHLGEMIAGSDVGAIIASTQIPCFPHALDYAAMGMVPAGSFRNRKFREKMVSCAATVPLAMQDVLYDAQTSGGLLIAVAASEADDLLRLLPKYGVSGAAAIGEISADCPGRIVVN